MQIGHGTRTNKRKSLPSCEARSGKDRTEGQRDATRRTISGEVTDVTSVGSYAICKGIEPVHQDLVRSIKIVSRHLSTKEAAARRSDTNVVNLKQHDSRFKKLLQI